MNVLIGSAPEDPDPPALGDLAIDVLPICDREAFNVTVAVAGPS